MNAPAPQQNGDEQRNLAGRRLGRYEVLTQLATGGMAAVYIARAQGVAGFERLVAIKVLHPHLAYEEEFISMFLDEARLAARIRHPNVVPTLDISDTAGDGYFLVMEYIEGDHLGALLGKSAKAGKRLPTPVVARVVLDALGGLGAAHDLLGEDGKPLNLVHRDISPHNVMVGNDGIGRLTDFGVAKAEVRMSSTRAGQFKGKLSYMAPEQASKGEATQRSDLFSMGIILWEALTGRRLFRGETNAATLNKILNEEVPAPSSLWPDLAPFDEICLKALAREPEDRFQTAAEFEDALDAVARDVEGVASIRQVGALVEELIGEKLGVERDRVQQAIEQFGKATIGEAMMPMPRDGSSSTAGQSLPQITGEVSLGSISASGMRPMIPEGTVMTAQGSIVQLAPQGNDPAKIVIIALLTAILFGGGVYMWQASRPRDTVSQPVYMPPTPAAAPAASEAPSAMEEPPAPEPAPEPAAEAATETAPEPAEVVAEAPEPVRPASMRGARSRGRSTRAAAPAPMAEAPPAPMPPPVVMTPPPTMRRVEVVHNPYLMR